jgi:hypothetical protein
LVYREWRTRREKEYLDGWLASEVPNGNLTGERQKTRTHWLLLYIFLLKNNSKPPKEEMFCSTEFIIETKWVIFLLENLPSILSLQTIQYELHWSRWQNFVFWSIWFVKFNYVLSNRHVFCQMIDYGCLILYEKKANIKRKS